jgi:DNA invertase Pin-like site-specific DNA recombinase
MNEKQKFGIYARVSTNKSKKNGEDKSQDPELQLKPLREYAKSRGWTVKEYVDIGISGAKDKRPQLDALMEDARKRRIDGIAVWKLDRFGRSLKFLVNAFEEFKALGIQFVSYTENLDFSTPMGKAMANLCGVFAEFERDLISERVKAGIASVQAKGKHFGKRPFDDASLLWTIRDMGHRKTPIRAIAAHLKVSKSFVHKTLKNSDQEVFENQGSEIREMMSA